MNVVGSCSNLEFITNCGDFKLDAFIAHEISKLKQYEARRLKMLQCTSMVKDSSTLMKFIKMIGNYPWFNWHRYLKNLIYRNVQPSINIGDAQQFFSGLYCNYFQVDGTKGLIEEIQTACQQMFQTLGRMIPGQGLILSDVLKIQYTQKVYNSNPQMLLPVNKVQFERDLKKICQNSRQTLCRLRKKYYAHNQSPFVLIPDIFPDLFILYGLFVVCYTIM